MEFETVRDQENAVIGFDLASNCYTEEDFFIRNLPANLGKGLAHIEVVKSKLIVNNGSEGTQSFEVRPDELSIIRDYLESRDTEPHIKLGGFGLRVAHIRFVNEPIRKKSSQKSKIE